MDVERLKALGVQPIVPEFDRIARVQGRTALAEEPPAGDVGECGDPRRTGVAASSTGTRSTSATRAWAWAPTTISSPDAQRIRNSYVARSTTYLVIAGATPEAARATARKASHSRRAWRRRS